VLQGQCTRPRGAGPRQRGAPSGTRGAAHKQGWEGSGGWPCTRLAGRASAGQRGSRQDQGWRLDGRGQAEEGEEEEYEYGEYEDEQEMAVGWRVGRGGGTRARGGQRGVPGSLRGSEEEEEGEEGDGVGG